MGRESKFLTATAVLRVLLHHATAVTMGEAIGFNHSISFIGPPAPAPQHMSTTSSASPLRGPDLQTGSSPQTSLSIVMVLLVPVRQNFFSAFLLASTNSFMVAFIIFRCGI